MDKAEKLVDHIIDEQHLHGTQHRSHYFSDHQEYRRPYDYHIASHRIRKSRFGQNWKYMTT
uniref:Uncharacterized protein n=1 Tax=Romanomermis culicivorax TaxID=13658 RepID=A0A915IKA1_ROMCU